MYGKPVLSTNGPQQFVATDNAAVSDGSEPDNGCLGNSEAVGGDPADRATPRPLSPTKLLPFLSNPHRNPSDADLEALRRRLHHAPRPLKKRSSITEPEGPAGPNIQKLLYQKTTLAAMETIPMETVGPAGAYARREANEDEAGGADAAAAWRADDINQLMTDSPEESLTPPPLPPRSPIPDPASCRSLLSPVDHKEEEEEDEGCPSSAVHQEDFPPYPPPPYPRCGDAEQSEEVVNLQPPEVTGQVTVPPVGVTA